MGEEEEETGVPHISVFTQNPTVPEIGMAPSREPLQPSVEEEEDLLQGEHKLRGEENFKYEIIVADIIVC